MFSVNDLLRKVEEAGLEHNFVSIEEMLFVNEVSDSKEKLQKLIDVVHSHCNRWRLKANVSKSVAIVFASNKVYIEEE